LSPEEALRMASARIIAAFNLSDNGVTVDALIAGVEKFEAPWDGAVQ
jgi:hypothetical protein